MLAEVLPILKEQHLPSASGRELKAARGTPVWSQSLLLGGIASCWSLWCMHPGAQRHTCITHVADVTHGNGHCLCDLKIIKKLV